MRSRKRRRLAQPLQSRLLDRSGLLALWRALVVKGEPQDNGENEGKKRKLWDRERAIHDEKLKLQRAYETFQEGVESTVNDVNASVVEARGLASNQPAVYKPRLQVLETRASCLLALVAGGEDCLERTSSG